MDEYKLIETVRGKPCLLYNGYSFRVKRTTAHGEVFWVCTKEKTEKCHGSIFIENKKIVKESEHVCKPDFAATIVKETLYNVKKRAREDDFDLPVSKIFREEFEKLYDQGLNFVTELPTYSSVKSCLNINRKRARVQRETSRREVECDIEKRHLYCQKDEDLLEWMSTYLKFEQ